MKHLILFDQNVINTIQTQLLLAEQLIDNPKKRGEDKYLDTLLHLIKVLRLVMLEIKTGIYEAKQKEK